MRALSFSSFVRSTRALCHARREREGETFPLSRPAFTYTHTVVWPALFTGFERTLSTHSGLSDRPSGLSCCLRSSLHHTAASQCQLASPGKAQHYSSIVVVLLLLCTTLTTHCCRLRLCCCYWVSAAASSSLPLSFLLQRQSGE